MREEIAFERTNEVEIKSWRPEAAERNVGLCWISILSKRRRSGKMKWTMRMTVRKVSVDKNPSFTRFVLFTKNKKQISVPGK